MGLDATVFCNCVEKGRLEVPHPFPERLYIDEDGRPEIRVDDLPYQSVLSLDEAHYAWLQSPPCKHQAC